MLNNDLLERLKLTKLRVTLPRRIVLEILDEADKPLNPYEIVDIAQAKGKKIDVVTVYRIMDAFEDFDIVHKLKGSNKFMICSTPCDDHCHHQFICDSCGSVDDLHIDDHGFLKKIAEKYSQIEISGHYFELSGLCKKCK